MVLPSDAPPPRDRAVLVTLALGVVAAIGVRLHVLDDDFPNPDIAGIVYEAERILEGLRPYVDVVEIKPPGAMLWAAAAIATLGRSLEALQLVHALWLGVGGLGVWWAVRAVHGRTGSTTSATSTTSAADERDRETRRAAALATAVYLVTASMFSYNYASWMTPASALAVGATLRGLSSGRLRWHLLAGAAAMLAFVTIQRAAVLGLLLPALWIWARPRGWPGVDRRAPIGWLLGATAIALPLTLWYAAVGEAGALWRGVIPLGVGLDYTTASEASPISALVAAFVQLVTVYWFAIGLFGLAAVAAWRQRPRDRSVWVPGLLWLVASIVGAGMGGLRFYVHYVVQYAPALALLVGHPALVRSMARAIATGSDDDAPSRRTARGLALGVGLLSLLQLLEIGLGHGHRYESMARRLTGGTTAAQAAGAHIRARTRADETIFAWGWTAWRVYYWAQRRSPSRIYKPLGTVTTFNTNTAIDVGEGVAFRDGPMADELVEAFDRAPPTYVVYSPSMVQTFGAKVDPLEQFTALRDRIAADYRVEAQFGDLRLLRRRAESR